MSGLKALKLCFVGACVCAAMMAGAIGASTTVAAEPWWHLTLGAAPTKLAAGTGVDDVQQLVVSATSGYVFLAEPTSLEEVMHGKRGLEELLYAIVPYNASAEEMQEALSEVFPSRRVFVRGGPGDETGSKPYIITFPKQSVEPIFVSGSFAAIFGKEPLSGGTEEASITEVTKGRPDGELAVVASNVGDANADSGVAPVTIADTLPAGLKAVAIEGLVQGEEAINEHPELECSLVAQQCEFKGALAPFAHLEVLVSVEAGPGAVSGEVNEATVAGGGAAAVSATRAVPIGGATPFGVETYEAALEAEGGSADIQAGSHPFQFTSTLTFNQTGESGSPPALPKDVNVNLPPGLVGNPTAFPRCTDEQFFTSPHADADTDECPASTVLGAATVRFVEKYQFGVEPVTVTVPVFNLQPSKGEPARLGFYVVGTAAVLDAAVRTGSDYGVTVSSTNIPEKIAFLSSTLTLWGAPGDPRHDNARGWGCVDDEFWHHGFSEAVPPCTPVTESQQAPFLVLPTLCNGPLETSVEVDSWQVRGQSTRVSSLVPLPSLVGCDRLPFEPSIELAPDSDEASAPTGLGVNVRVPQGASLDPNGAAESAVEDISVTLPTGLQLNPSAAAGLQGCTTGEIGLKSTVMGRNGYEFTSTLPEPLEPGVNFCPEASKLGTVKIKTPLLPNPLEGAVYLATPQNFSRAPLENPFGTLIAMYIVAQDPISGVLVKLPVTTTPNSITGQLTATVSDEPELPFEEAEIHFFNGPRAPLATPATCGDYSGTATLTPWSGNPAVEVSSTPFVVTTGPNGSGVDGCASRRPFAPSFSAGVSNPEAGGFSHVVTSLTRPDQDEVLGPVDIQLPPGLSGLLTNVSLCTEPQASAGECGEASLIGHAVVNVGLGSEPYTVTGGNVYITTGYKGGSFGLSIVTPATAGPFVLEEGRPVVVRAALYVDPHSGALRIVSDSLPTILDGIPLNIQAVTVTIDREHFAFNPTNCNKLAITGVLGSSEGSTTTVSAPFQVTNCAALKFAPKLAVSTSAHASKKLGASLTFKATYPSAPQGTQANIAAVKVDLPKALPTEQRTLAKACLAAVFEANPANCPSGSIVGHAKLHTPLLPVPLEGPAYFVSHGGEAFPSLTMVLQGDNVTIDLVSTTFIKNGVTSATLKSTPDAPFSSFELTLPEGKFSALAANLPAKAKFSFCGQKLAMPTALRAQNGAEIHESTPITVTGCPKAKKIKRRRAR